MLRSKLSTALLTITVVAWAVVGGAAQEIQQRSDDQPVYYSDRPKIDRYLDAEVWVDHADGEYYIGDNIVINFRVSRDAFVAVYSVDSRGMVNLLFPSDPGEDNFVRGGETYRLPGQRDDYDLVVNGPEGTENIQIIASREKFPIPNWYHNSGLVCDWDDRYDYMDYLNGRYFIRYDGQRFAYDRAVLFVNEWEDYYFRPVYQPYYPSWSVSGNVYIDYGWGYSVYVNGVYWGCTPLYLPRIAVGWHTVTIYDPWGYCWENDVHISHYNTVVLNRNIVHTSSSVKSKYKVVREAGYRDPVSAGYSNYAQKTKTVAAARVTTTNKSTVTSSKVANGKSSKVVTYSADEVQAPSNKKYVRGSSTLSRTDRGYETDLSVSSSSKGKSTSLTGNAYRATTNRSGSSGTGQYKSKKDVSSSGSSRSATGQTSGYYQKKSGSSSSSYDTKSSNSRESNSATSSGSYRKSNSARSGNSSAVTTNKNSNNKSTYNTTKRSTNQSSSSNSGSYRKATSPNNSKSSGNVKQSSPSKSTNSPSRKSNNSSSNSKSSSSSKSKGKG